MKLDSLKDKKILILGFGREGRNTLRFLKKAFPKKKVGVADAKLGKNYLNAIDDYEFIIKSPGVPIHIPEVERAFKKGKVTSATEIFLENCPATIIGVTGSKGKSTTSAWIYQTLKRAKLPAKLVGNIGKPVLSHLLNAKPADIFVYEMSAHQLYGLKKSPHIALLLNVYREHLDYYSSFREYVGAKANIARHQKKKDFLIYNSKNKICRQIASLSRARKIPIQGEYYRLNLAAVKQVARIFRVPVLKKLETLPHRLEFVGEFKKIKFYNDSLSTIPEAAIFALDQLGGKVETMILGGFDRGQDFAKLAKRILNSKIKNVILFRPSGERILQELKRARSRFHLNAFFANSMAEAVKLALRHTLKDKICLLSPASPSFNLFKDYKDRGNSFKKFVKNYAKQQKF